MTKDEALITIIEDAQRQKNSLTSYTRVNRACRALGMTNGETEKVLARLEYHSRSTGQPHDWLADALARKKADRRGHAKLE